MKIAIVGVVDSLGAEIIRLMEEKGIPMSDLDVLDTQEIASVGKKVGYGNDNSITIKSVSTYDFSRTDIVLFTSNKESTRDYIEKALSNGVIVIGSPDCFKLYEEIPAIIPEINGDLLDNEENMIFAMPNSIVIQVAMVLANLKTIGKIERVVLSTYQAVSEKGKEGSNELFKQTKSRYGVAQTDHVNVFKMPIAFNCIPHIGDFDERGHTTEELQIIYQLNNILGCAIAVNVTCVRVPVFVGNCVSIAIEFENDISIEDVYDVLDDKSGILIFDRMEDGGYATPVDCVGEYDVFVSRIRRDMFYGNIISMWIVTDNLRKGSALNALQIAEKIMDREHAYQKN